VASLGLGLYLYFVPIFAQSLGATFLDLGYIGTAGALTYAVAPFFVGQLADRISRRVLYAVAVLINLTATFSLTFCRSVSDVIMIRSFAGLGLAFFWPTTETLVLDLTRREERVREMGRYSISWGSAFLIGPFLGGIIVQNFGFFTLFMISCALSFSSLAVILLISPKQSLMERNEATTKVKEQFRIAKKLLPWYGLLVCYGLIFSVVSSIFPGYANSIGVSAVLVGVLFTAFNLARVATNATSGHYLHIGERKALGLASFLLVVACILIVLFPTFSVFLVAIPLMGGCFALLFPVSIGLISRHFSESQLGAAVGFYESTYGIGAVIGPILAGTLATILDVRLGFVSAAFAGVLMMIISARAKTYKD
jgi:MFS family permease